MNWNNWVRQTHPSLSIAFTVAVTVNIVAVFAQEVHSLGGDLGAAPARLAPVHWFVLVCAAACHQLVQRAKHPLNGRPTSCAFGDYQSDVVSLFLRAESSSLICNCDQQIRQG